LISPNGPWHHGRPRAAQTRPKPWPARDLHLDACLAGSPVVHYDSLGALALLAQVPQDAARENAYVAAITRMAGTGA
jgi:hypothetical protein